MGKTVLGSPSQQVGKADLMSPEQMKFLNSLITGLGGQSQQALGGLLGGYSEDLFQSGVVDPAQRNYEQQILPSIQQRFGDANASSSSALNQALTQSAGDLSNVLAGQRINLQNSASQQQLGALSQILSLINSHQFAPIVQGPQGGLLKDIVSAGGNAVAAYAASSRDVKENIIDYEKGLDLVRNFNVKQYDYNIDVPVKKDRIGLIAEDLPEEIVGEIDGIKAVDIYGLVSILVNCVKQLDAKVKELEAK